MSYFIFSTLSADVSYDTYLKNSGDLPIKTNTITIKGGTGIATPKRLTNYGAIATKITDDQLAVLKTNPVFKIHCDNGFVTILKSKEDGEVAAANMTSRDVSAPMNENDLTSIKSKTTNKKTG